LIRAIKNRTKTNKSFQKPEERQALAESELYRSFVEQCSAQLAAGMPVEHQEEGRQRMAVLEQLVSPADRPPSAAEAQRLKESPAYRQILAAAQRQYEQLKERLIPTCRLRWRGPEAEWLEVAVVLDETGEAKYPSLLGTGGNDGRLDFTNNFMQRLGEVFVLGDPEGRASEKAASLLRHALWGEPANALLSSAIGQYDPGSAGGANSTNGAMGDSLVNSWNFILMMEGALVLKARATRRLDPVALARASAPFAVRSHAAGFATAGSENSGRGEQWLPIWSRPASYRDIATVFGEARMQLERLPANRPVDVARALSRLGTARGIDAFERFGFLERNGQSTFAVPLGRIPVRERAHRHLIDDLAPWLERLRRLAAGKHATPRLQQAEKRLADSVFAVLTHDYSSERWRGILLAAAAIELLQQSGSAIEAGPMPPLSPAWVSVLGEDPTVRLAAALGSAAGAYSFYGRPSDPVRHHWLPLERGARRFQKTEGRLKNDSRVVIRGRDALVDCAELVKRRFVEAQQSGKRNLPLVAAKGCGASLADLQLLLSGAMPLEPIFALARALMSVRWDQWTESHFFPRPAVGSLPDEAWLALRLSSLPWALPSGLRIAAESSPVRRLLAGDGAGAVAVALDRLVASGIRPPLRAGAVTAAKGRLWAAALAFPIDPRTAWVAAVKLDPRLKGKNDD
jgi:CRISPR-associated protein Csx17